MTLVKRYFRLADSRSSYMQEFDEQGNFAQGVVPSDAATGEALPLVEITQVEHDALLATIMADYLATQQSLKVEHVEKKAQTLAKLGLTEDELQTLIL